MSTDPNACYRQSSSLPWYSSHSISVDLQRAACHAAGDGEDNVDLAVFSSRIGQRQVNPMLDAVVAGIGCPFTQGLQIGRSAYGDEGVGPSDLVGRGEVADRLAEQS